MRKTPLAYPDCMFPCFRVVLFKAFLSLPHKVYSFLTFFAKRQIEMSGH